MPRKGAVSEYLAKIGRKGGKASGKARMAKLTSEQRSEVARKAAAARWKKVKGVQKSPTNADDKRSSRSQSVVNQLVQGAVRA